MTITRQIATALIEGALADGGATFNLTDNQDRYIVGGLLTFYVYAEFARGSHDRMIREFGSYESAGNRKPDTIGSWLDTEPTEPVVYVDYGTRHGSLGVALELAKQRGELAIWDSQDGVEIRVK